MDAKLIQEIEESLKQISPWPWNWEETEEYYDQLMPKYAFTGSWLDKPNPIIETDSGFYGPKGIDAEFIQKAPERIAALVEEVNRLKAELEVMRLEQVNPLAPELVEKVKKLRIVLVEAAIPLEAMKLVLEQDQDYLSSLMREAILNAVKHIRQTLGEGGINAK